MLKYNLVVECLSESYSSFKKGSKYYANEVDSATIRVLDYSGEERLCLRRNFEVVERCDKHLAPEGGYPASLQRYTMYSFHVVSLAAIDEERIVRESLSYKKPVAVLSRGGGTQKRVLIHESIWRKAAHCGRKMLYRDRWVSPQEAGRMIEFVKAVKRAPYPDKDKCRDKITVKVLHI